MTQVQNGNTVKVHYTGRLEDGEVFDSSDGREPLEFVAGQGMVIPGFDIAVEGMSVGDSKTVTIPAEDAYGPVREEMIFSISRGMLPEGMQPQTGEALQLNMQDGQTMVAEITEVTDENLVLNANHPLAGKTLIFDIELVAID